MKRSIVVLLVIGVTIIFFGCSHDNSLTVGPDLGDQATAPLAKKPSPNLRGTMDLYYDVTAAWPEEPVWVGTIDIEGHGTYSMRFFHLTLFKEYSQASPFEERFEIYEEGGDPDNYEDDVIYLAGPDVGVTTLANKPPDPCKYRMNGEIDVATGPFEMWMGRKVHMSGIITWKNLGTSEEPVYAPDTAPGTLRIN